jgi:hypothetical protein
MSSEQITEEAERQEALTEQLRETRMDTSQDSRFQTEI